MRYSVCSSRNNSTLIGNVGLIQVEADTIVECITIEATAITLVDIIEIMSWEILSCSEEIITAQCAEIIDLTSSATVMNSVVY